MDLMGSKVLVPREIPPFCQRCITGGLFGRHRQSCAARLDPERWTNLKSWRGSNRSLYGQVFLGW